MTDEQSRLQRHIIKHVIDDGSGTTDEATLAVALGFLQGEFVPFGEHDVAALPVPYGRATEVVLTLEDGSLFPRITAVVSVGENAERVIAYDEFARAWTVIADGNLSDVRCVEDEEPAYVRHQGDDATVCWGDDWEVPLPAGAKWRVGMMDMGAFDDAIRLIEVLDGTALLHHSDGGVSTLPIDATNVTPPWNADAPLEWKVVRRDEGYWLEKRGETPALVGMDDSLIFVSGDDFLGVHWVVEAGVGHNVIRSVLYAGKRVELRGHDIRITDVKATEARLVITYLQRGDPAMVGVLATFPQTMVVNRATGAIADDPPGLPPDERWEHATRTRELDAGGEHVVLVEMARLDEHGHHVDRGVRVLTAKGEAFYRLRGVAFDAIQLVEDTLWAWRPTPGGIILSRYPLRRD